jgi:hypothetical protein
MSKKDKKGAEAKPVEEIKPVVTAEPGQTVNIMDDLTKKQAFKKFSWRGKDINQLIAMKIPEFG